MRMTDSQPPPGPDDLTESERRLHVRAVVAIYTVAIGAATGAIAVDGCF